MSRTQDLGCGRTRADSAKANSRNTRSTHSAVRDTRHGPVVFSRVEGCTAHANLRKKEEEELRFLATLALFPAILCSSLVYAGDTEYFRHIIFDNSLTPDTYFYSYGQASGSSSVEQKDGRLPVETETFVSPPNALRLRWQSQVNGGWEAEKPGKEEATVAIPMYRRISLRSTPCPPKMEPRDLAGKDAILLRAGCSIRRKAMSSLKVGQAQI